MWRENCDPRPDWRQRVESQGFVFDLWTRQGVTGVTLRLVYASCQASAILGRDSDFANPTLWISGVDFFV